MTRDLEGSTPTCGVKVVKTTWRGAQQACEEVEGRLESREDSWTLQCCQLKVLSVTFIN